MLKKLEEAKAVRTRRFEYGKELNSRFHKNRQSEDKADFKDYYDMNEDQQDYND